MVQCEGRPTGNMTGHERATEGRKEKDLSGVRIHHVCFSPSADACAHPPIRIQIWVEQTMNVECLGLTVLDRMRIRRHCFLVLFVLKFSPRAPVDLFVLAI